MRHLILFYLCFILLSQAASEPAASGTDVAAPTKDQTLEEQAQDILTKVLSELDGVKDSFDLDTKAAIQKALNDVKEQGSYALPEGQKIQDKDIALTSHDDTEKNIADTHQDLSELEDAFKEESAQIRERMTELLQDLGAEAELLKQDGDEILAQAEEVKKDGEAEVNDSVVGDFWDHITKKINDFYSSSSTQAPATPIADAPAISADDSTTKTASSAPVAADDSAVAPPAAAATAAAATPVEEAPAAATPVPTAVSEETKAESPAPAATEKQMEAVVATSSGSSGSIMSALFIICSVISAAGFTLYCIGNQKHSRVLTYSHKESELDRLFQGQSYYQSRENRRHFY